MTSNNPDTLVKRDELLDGMDIDTIDEVVRLDLAMAEPLLRWWHISWQQRSNGLRLVGFVIPDDDAAQWAHSLRALASLARTAPFFVQALRSLANKETEK